MNLLCRRLSFVLSPIVWITASLLLDACQATTEPMTSGYEYQPLVKGNFWIYAVTEQQFSIDGSSTARTYQVRETITQSYTDPSTNDLSARVVFRVERQRRSDESQNWQPDLVCSIQLAGDQLIKTESNSAYVKLVFPVIDQFQWNGNAFNTEGEDMYQLKNTGTAFTVLNQSFAETATIVQQNDSTLVSQDKRLEIYARKVGLIYKENVQLQFCSSSPSCVGKARIDYGVRQYFRLISYGK